MMGDGHSLPMLNNEAMGIDTNARPLAKADGFRGGLQNLTS